MNSYYRYILFIFLSLYMVSSINAQISKNNFEIGLGAGTTVYQGDIEPGALGSYKRLHPAINVYAGKWLSQYFLVQGIFMHGAITAYDADWSTPAYKQLRNLKFHTAINEAGARIVFSPFGNAAYTSGKHWYPYVFAGAGVAFTHIKRNWSGIDSSFLSAKTINNLALDSAHKLPAVIPSLPFGAGVRYVISAPLSVFAEITYRLPATDYLDGFSYVANPKQKDDYYNFSIGINYTFLKNANKCPTVKR